jgi:tetratricopeptide (TPR) repeat protein
MGARAIARIRRRRSCRMLAAGWMLVTHLASSPALGEPFVPLGDEQVIERLPAAVGPTFKELQELRLAPANVDAAVSFARRYIRLAKEESDPRYYGYAEGALGPWWGDPSPPAIVLTPRAMIKQSRHDFDGALRDLDEALRVQPANMQAWLARAAILRLLARYDEARSSCMPLADAKDALLAITCIGEVDGLNGLAPRSFDALERYYRGERRISDEQRQWTLTVLADMATRLGRTETAEIYFKDALSLPKPPLYLQAAFADFLLDQRRAEEAIALYSNETRQDALLLRLALAKRLVDAADLSPLVAEIQSRFEVSRMRRENVHLGDEARFALYLLRRPHEALDLAQRNWSLQRTPQDARILLEAAFAADDPEKAKPAIELLARAGVSHERLATLAAEAKAFGGETEQARQRR